MEYLRVVMLGLTLFLLGFGMGYLVGLVDAARIVTRELEQHKDRLRSFL